MVANHTDWWPDVCVCAVSANCESGFSSHGIHTYAQFKVHTAMQFCLPARAQPLMVWQESVSLNKTFIKRS